MKVAVVGCGYVGLVSGICLASAGHEVVGIEVDERRRAQIAAGDAPFYEPGLTELLHSGLETGAYRVSGELADADPAEVVLLAVQTPPTADGSIDLSYLEAAARDLYEAFTYGRRRVVAVRSTVIPGTTERVLGEAFGPEVAIASNPEFLREGSAVEDFLRADRVVVGCRDAWGRERLAELYRPLEAPVVFTTPTTAELAKYTSNAFLATLVSFSNEIAHVCEALPGVDVEDVLSILHSDRRLNPAAGERPAILSYVKAGCGFGGSCLPKDLSALIAAGEAEGIDLPLLKAVRSVNEGQPGRLADATGRALGSLEGRTVAVLGVAFKAGTDDLRASPGLRIVDELLERGASVTIYDPLVSAQALAQYGPLRVARDVADALEGADACVVTTTAPETAALGDLLADGGHPGLVVVDGRRVLDADELADAVYVAVGRAAVGSQLSLELQ